MYQFCNQVDSLCNNLNSCTDFRTFKIASYLQRGFVIISTKLEETKHNIFFIVLKFILVNEIDYEYLVLKRYMIVPGKWYALFWGGLFRQVLLNMMQPM